VLSPQPQLAMHLPNRLWLCYCASLAALLRPNMSPRHPNLECLRSHLCHEQSIPAYATLSHTWGPDGEEVTYEDLIKRTGEHKPGYKKTRFCGNLAKKDGLQYFWIDTCCIKQSHPRCQFRPTHFLLVDEIEASRPLVSVRQSKRHPIQLTSN
jgi:hypothetical protein